MNTITRKFAFTILAVLCRLAVLHATPSTIIWIPSVDFQPFGTFHFGVDNYFTVFKKGIGQGGVGFPTDVGLTAGVLPFEKIQAEVGVDLLEPTQSPWTFNAKIGIPESAFGSWSPAISVGGVNFGVEKNLTDYNIIYGVIAKTLPVVGRLSVGYYSGNKVLLVDNNGNADNKGILLSWDKQVTEINDNLWLAIDYQGGKSSLGALSCGFAWSFSKNVSVLIARDFYNNNAPATMTTQLDINL
jgi:hypothetical protein